MNDQEIEKILKIDYFSTSDIKNNVTCTICNNDLEDKEKFV